MATVNRMTGTSWHVEYIECSDIARRHRARCVYYQREPHPYCKYYCENYCRGSAHCDHYCESTGNKAKKKSPVRRRNAPSTVKSNDDVIRVPLKKTTDISTSSKSKRTLPEIFEININDITIDKKFKNYSFDRDRIKKLIKHYKDFNELDRPIVVAKANGKYVLKKNYLQFLVAKALKLKYISAEIGTKDEVMAREKFRKVGNHVWNRERLKNGVITRYTLKTVFIRYEDGIEKEYDIFKIAADDVITIV